LSWLRDNADAFRGKTVLDFGTGSGVLAIGALLMGAARACGVDMEAQSVDAAARNAALNGVEANLELFLADGSEGGGALPPGRDAGEEKFDAVVANILVGPVLSLAPLFAQYCAPGGRVCLSGVLTTQTPDVLAAYEPFFEDMTVREENGWAVVDGTRLRN
jgi:ribosomal protein L11 methyltransferase